MDNLLFSLKHHELHNHYVPYFFTPKSGEMMLHWRNIHSCFFSIAGDEKTPTYDLIIVMKHLPGCWHVSAPKWSVAGDSCQSCQSGGHPIAAIRGFLTTAVLVWEVKRGAKEDEIEFKSMVTSNTLIDDKQDFGKLVMMKPLRTSWWWWLLLWWRSLSLLNLY